MQAQEIELIEVLRKVQDAARRGEIGVLDPQKTCGGGRYTLWDQIDRALEGAPSISQPPKENHEH